MVFCCFKRNTNNEKKIMKKIYLKKSNDILIQKKYKYKNRMCNDLIFSYLYGSTAIGSCIATKLSLGISSPVTIPTATVSTFSCISSYNSYKKYELKYLVINEILQEHLI